MTADAVTCREGAAPLIVSLPHTGTRIPSDIEAGLLDGWQARCDSDWHVEKLYDFALTLGATIVRTEISRTVIDVNRDPSGASLYPGMTTTGLCPQETFEGVPLYAGALSAAEIARRRAEFFVPYHAALLRQISRLRQQYSRIVLFDAHAIRSRLPRLFAGLLPQFNIGTNEGRSCAPELAEAVTRVCAQSSFSYVLNGRFKGGWITRHYGAPQEGVHAIQMELAFRGYLKEPQGAISPQNWPVAYDEDFAAPLRAHLVDILNCCVSFARSHEPV